MRRAWAAALLMAAFGCEGNPCDGQPAVCIAVHVSGAVPSLDRLDTTVSLEGERTLHSHTDNLQPPTLRLPVRFALLLAGDTTGVVNVEIGGSASSVLLARGSRSLRVPPSGQWLRITMNASTLDLATDNDGGAEDGGGGDGAGGDGAAPCSTESCPDGTCYGDVCCRGCWDGTACQPGTATSACGVNGAACLSCESGNECKQDSCSAGACAQTDVTGGCTGGVCIGGACHCGAAGEPCCATGPPCASSMVCTVGTCGTCGAIGQPCCTNGTACASGICNASMCVSCGGATQPCCSGSLCNANLTCAGSCQCGGRGQKCCDGTNCNNANLMCVGGNCQCGGLGQPCCDGTTCNPGAGCCGGGTAGVCSVETSVQFCGRYMKNCGLFTANDTCNVSRTVNCGGACTCPQTCQSNVCTTSAVGLGSACGCDEQCASYPNQICNGACCKINGVSCQNNTDCCSGCCTTDTKKCVNGC